YRLADREGLVLLVTGSSDVSVSDELLWGLERRAGLAFGKLYLAAHSGGNVGLARSLGRVRRPDRIAMLDNFYFAESLSHAIQREVAAGAVCAGYLTAHNRERYEKRFMPFVYCPIQDRSDLGHDGGVNRCLGKYLARTSCD
ncbi:MAG: hypothetical protein HY553_22150, partial [Elusimicrobia bacterium]|nr:hypothetical protein [Elusimicrobiota bacterium]